MQDTQQPGPEPCADVANPPTLAAENDAQPPTTEEKVVAPPKDAMAEDSSDDSSDAESEPGFEFSDGADFTESSSEEEADPNEIDITGVADSLQDCRQSLQELLMGNPKTYKSDGPRTEHEMDPVMVPDVAPIPSELPEHCEVRLLGHVHGVVDNSLLVQGLVDQPALDVGTLLCFEDKTPFGRVEDLIGQVHQPLYVVFFRDADIKKEEELSTLRQRLTRGHEVYFVKDEAAYVFPAQLRDKGTDASNVFDEEDDEQYFSDDEAERKSRKARRQPASGASQQHQAQSQSGTGPWEAWEAFGSAPAAPPSAPFQPTFSPQQSQAFSPGAHKPNSGSPSFHAGSPSSQQNKRGRTRRSKPKRQHGGAPWSAPSAVQSSSSATTATAVSNQTMADNMAMRLGL